MLRKIIKSTIIVIMIMLLTLTGNIMVALATSQSDLNDVESKINETQNKIDQVEEELSDAMTQIRSLNAEIAEYENDISDLNTQIDEVNAKIESAEQEIKKAEEDQAHQQALLEQRLVAIYKSGNTTYLDALLSSKNILDFVNKYYYVSKMAECDQNLLNQIETNKIAIEESKKLLETSKEQIEALKKSKEDTANALKDSQSMKEAYVAQLSDEEKSLNEQLDQFEEDKKKIEEELKKLALENNGGTAVIPGNPSEAGYIFPVAGLNIYNINRRYYPSYPGHTGVDVNINVTGKKIVAVKDGTVVTSTALRNSNGTYRSYGEYVVIDHHDGTMTLYAHMYPDSRTVSVGDTVVQGQVIGTVGTTGNSTGNHLHFEVRINGRCVNPLPYLQ